MFGKTKPCAECNLVLLGVMGCGKSALTVKFLTKRFISEYDPYLEDIYSSDEIVDQQPVTVRVMDTCDQEGPVNCERYLNFIFLYNLDLEIVPPPPKLDKELVEWGDQNIQSFLLMFSLRQVSQSDAEALATRYGCLFFEVSACRDFHSVQHIFYKAVRRAKPCNERRNLLSAAYVSEDKALLGVHSFSALDYKELPAPTTAKLVTVKTSRVQSKRRAATLTLLKGFKIF
ncbi:ras-like protein family member 12 [Cyprinodon tularosa]|uniref:ras-like protein family member 12 n=1 Tax=Cyprinodon tularosa TaxID=77115 RepID=UPI0018E271B9|nr:ras-like protein family member 12 [Cyprinodon tularosa]